MGRDRVLRYAGAFMFFVSGFLPACQMEGERQEARATRYAEIFPSPTPLAPYFVNEIVGNPELEDGDTVLVRGYAELINSGTKKSYRLNYEGQLEPVIEPWSTYVMYPLPDPSEGMPGLVVECDCAPEQESGYAEVEGTYHVDENGRPSLETSGYGISFPEE